MKLMASKSHKQEKTEAVIIPEKKKKVGNADSGEVSNSLSLPHDVIINDILTRIPVDSLMRFKCVCKLWLRSFSNDSDFMKLYSRRNGTHGFIHLASSYTDDDSDTVREIDDTNDITKSNGIVFYNVDKKEEKVIRFRPETGLFNRKLRIRDSLNGLVLLSHQEDDYRMTDHVFNPITGHLIKLPDLKIKGLKAITGNLFFRLAYDAAIEKYKVVCFYKGKTHRIFKIVTLDGKSDSWRNVTALSSPRVKVDEKAVFANGCLNWLTHDRFGGGGCRADQGKILSLDVSEEKFYAIDYPKGVSDACELREMGGSLCFFDYMSTTGKIKLWVLKENEEKQSKRNQHNEWLEFDVDIMQNNNVPELFSKFENYECFALVKDPTLKIVFWTSNERIREEPGRGLVTWYIPEIYSYDVESKTFAFICEHGGRTFVKWDLSSLLHFQSTVAG